MPIVDDLRAYKEKNNLTYRELGALLGLTKKVCYDLLKGKRKFIGLDTLQKAQALLDMEA